MLALSLQPCFFICLKKKNPTKTHLLWGIKKKILKLICIEAPSAFGMVARDWCPLWPRKVLLAQTIVGGGGNNTKHAKEVKDEHGLSHMLLWESVSNNTGPSNWAAAFIVCQSRLILVCRNRTGIPRILGEFDSTVFTRLLADVCASPMPLPARHRQRSQAELCAAVQEGNSVAVDGECEIRHAWASTCFTCRLNGKWQMWAAAVGVVGHLHRTLTHGRLKRS